MKEIKVYSSETRVVDMVSIVEVPDDFPDVVDSTTPLSQDQLDYLWKEGMVYAKIHEDKGYDVLEASLRKKLL